MKRLASMFLALCLILGMAPPRTLAADAPPELVAALADAANAPDTDTATLPAPEAVNALDTDSGQASLTAASGTCGDNLTWTLDDAGTLTISGTGAMADYIPYDGTYTTPWYDSCESIITVIIESGVTSIGDYAFIHCHHLNSVTTPDSVTSIGNNAFFDCDGLTNKGITATIFDNVTSIGEEAFFSCDSLESVTIPSGITSIGNGAFCNSTSLTGVNVESGNTQYSSENGILFNKDKTVLYCYPAGKQDETTYTIPDSVTSISNNAFGGCSKLKNVTIHKGVTSIKNMAFGHCTGLTSIVIPDGLTSIDYGMFSGCSALKNVTIPNGVTSIGEFAFEECSALTDVDYGGTKAQWGAVTIGEDNQSLTNATIHCTDGDIISTQSADTYTVTFDGNGSTAGSMSDQTFTAAAPLNANAFTRDGYAFAGWNTKPDGTGTAYGDSAAYSGPTMTLYAQWEVLPPVEDCTVTFIGNGGTPQSEQYVVEMNTKMSLPQNPARDGYEFMGWFTTPDASGTAFNFDTPITENLTLYAGWSSSRFYRITARATSGGTVQASHVEAPAGTTVTLTVTISPGYALEALIVTDSNGNEVAVSASYAFIMPESDVTVEAVFKEGVSGANECHVFFEANGGGNPNAMEEVTVSAGASYTLPQCQFTPPENMKFRAWQCVRYDADSKETVTEGKPGDTLDLSGVVSLIATALWESVPESDILGQGACGDSLTWTLTRDGTLTISGSGDMSAYSATTPTPWYGDRQRVKALILASGVGTIGAYAFDGCAALTTMSAADTLTSVAPHAFDGCTALETVSFGGTLTQWDNVILNTSDNDPLEFADVKCGNTGYNMFRALESLGKMNAFADREWKFPAPLARFRNLYIDVEDVRDAENNDSVGALERKDSAAALTREEGMKAYAAESGSTVLTIPKETFQTFEEGSHRITATFQTKANPRDKDDDGFRETSEVYTVFPEGPIVIDAAEIVKDAVQDVSYTARVQTTPKLSDRFYRFEIVSAQLGDDPLTVTTVPDAKQTEGEEATQVQKLGEQDFFFHPNGRFTGVPSIPGDYKLTVKLQVRREANSNDWYDAVPDDSHTNPVTVEIHVEGKTAANIEATSPGYVVIEEPSITLEQGNQWNVTVTVDDPADELVTVYLDNQVLVRGTDYLVYVSNGGQWVRLEDAGAVTQMAIQVTKTNISIGLHSVNLEFKHEDIRGNTQTKNVARPVNVTQKTTRVSGGGGGGGGGGSSAPTTYAIKAVKASNGKITLSATKIAAGKTVTITLTPNKGYAVQSVSATDSKKKSVALTRDGNKYTFTMPKLTVTVSATFTPSAHSISVSSAQHGKVTLDKSTATSGAVVNGTATPDNGYMLSAVTVRDASGKSVKVETFNNGKFTFLMPSGNVTVSATFTPSAYSVSAASAEHGKVTLDKSSAAVGAAVNGTATPDKGYLLSAVTVRDASGNNVKSETFDNGKFTFLMPSGKVTVSATFTVKCLASFVDIQGSDWFFDDAEWAYQKSILRGVTAQYWEPQSKISAVTSVVTLERLDGVNLSEYDTGAEDGLDNNAWYVAAARWAKVKGILPSGLSVDRDALSRGDFALMLANYLRYRGISEASGDATFTDADTMSPAELDAFRILQKAGVFQGYKDGTINPRGYLSRAHLSALLHRLSNYIIKAEQERFTGA